MRVLGIRVWITAEETKWRDQVPKNISERVLAILGNAFQELVDEGVIDISADELDATEVDE